MLVILSHTICSQAIMVQPSISLGNQSQFSSQTWSIPPRETADARNAQVSKSNKASMLKILREQKQRGKEMEEEEGKRQRQ